MQSITANITTSTSTTTINNISIIRLEYGPSCMQTTKDYMTSTTSNIIYMTRQALLPSGMQGTTTNTSTNTTGTSIHTINLTRQGFRPFSMQDTTATIITNTSSSNSNPIYMIRLEFGPSAIQGTNFTIKT